MSQYVGRNCPKAFSLVLSVDSAVHMEVQRLDYYYYMDNVYVLALYGKILRNVKVDLGLYLNYGLSFKKSDFKKRGYIFFRFSIYLGIFYKMSHFEHRVG